MSISFDSLMPNSQVSVVPRGEPAFTITVRNATGRWLDATLANGAKITMVFADLPRTADLAEEAAKGVMQSSARRIEAGMAAYVLAQAGNAQFWVESASVH